MMTASSTSPATVVVVGVGMTPVGEHWERSLRELALDAISAARSDAGGLRPQALYVANMAAPALSAQSHLGALIADFAGLRGVEAVTVEAAGASGGMAVRHAYLALRSGLIDCALVVGVEKVTDKVSAIVDAALVTASDADYEAIHGITPTAQAALLMQRYLHETGAPSDAFAGFSLAAHAHAVSNPNAMYRRALKPESYSRASIVSEPLNLYDAAPVADGAAAVILTRADSLPQPASHRAARILGSAAATSALALHDQADPLIFEAAAASAQAAFAEAGLTPEDVDFFELHDRFSIFAALALEASGFSSRGEGWKLARNGVLEREGRLPICTFGGSKARGDAGGATGVYQIAEAALQVTGRAGENQVPDAEIGLAQCIGGTGGTVVSHLLGASESS